MDYKNFNKYLKDFNNIRSQFQRNNDKSLKGVKLIDTEVIKEITDANGSQGEEGMSFEVYKLPFDDLHIRLTIKTDSYGDNEFVSGVEFVTPKQVKVTKFEPKES